MKRALRPLAGSEGHPSLSQELEGGECCEPNFYSTKIIDLVIFCKIWFVSIIIRMNLDNTRLCLTLDFASH